MSSTSLPVHPTHPASNPSHAAQNGDRTTSWSRADLDAAARDLANAIEGEVRFGLHDRMLYATDASIYQVEPLGVVVPRSTEDAIRAVKFCAERGLPVLPRGGGTSLAGQCTAEAIVLDLSPNCRELIELDTRARTCRVEAGITVDDLNDAIRQSKLHFAPDPSTSRHATVAGCIGNNAAGSHSVLYGRTAESLLGVDLCLPDGRRVTLDEGAALRDPLAAELTKKVADIVRPLAPAIRDRFPKTKRRNAGYALDMVLDGIEASNGGLEKVNLAHLICGSEGTLGVTLGAQLKLFPVPIAKGLAVIAFDTLDDAITAVNPILTTAPAAVELLDDLIVELARRTSQQRGTYVKLLPTRPGRARRSARCCMSSTSATTTLTRSTASSPAHRGRAVRAPVMVGTHTDAQVDGGGVGAAQSRRAAFPRHPW
jgi:FAD/FMN-containing dehydrogenase